MPPHDETARSGSAGSVRRPPPARARATGSGGGGARRPTVSGKARTTPAPGRPPARSGGGGGGRPPVRPPTGGNRPGGNGKGRPPGGGKRKRTGKQQRRRWLKVLSGVVVGSLVLLGVFVGVVYASTDVPSPDSITNKQTTILYYSDGVTEMARLSDGENRTNVTLDKVSKPARESVLAAENRNFYNDPGISFTGIVRAAWNNVTGGSTQGGSTITQQYVKNAFLSSDQTFSRKFKELLLSIKLDNQYSKDEILESYLNTIYFGRGAYGIEAAANTYFGVKAADLTAEQGAVLAVLVRSPSYYDPANNPEEAQDRWGRVLDGMAEQGWVDAAARKAMVYPAVLPNTGSNMGIPSGPEGFVVRQALAELKGYGYEDVEAAGLRITTTINKGYQDAAVAAVNDVMQGEEQTLREALVSVDPRTGGVVAYYGNAQSSSEDPAVDTTDYAQALKQPGSSFKPYTLAAALQSGYSVNTRRDGTSPQEFPDRPGKPVRNSENAQCANCTLKEAITKSLNTTFYGLAYDVGGEKVADVARKAAGIPATWEVDDPLHPAGDGLAGYETLSIPGTNDTGGSIGIGEYAVRPIQQAVGFATLAAGGVYHPAHFVASVADSAGTVLKPIDGSMGSQQVIPPEVASDVTFAMEDVAKASKRPLDGNRPVASKTGTQGIGAENSDAWMVGYTPSISTAVWMGTQGVNPITNAQGRIIYGSGLPGAIWQQYMDAVLQGTPEEPLPAKALIKGDPDKSNAQETTQAPAPTSRAPAPTTRAPAPTTAEETTSEPVKTTQESLPASSSESSPSSSAGGRPSVSVPVPTQSNR